MTKNTRIPMVFGDGKEHNGADGWFWGDLTGKGPADEPNTFPFVLQMGVWRGELTLEQARELRDLRGYQWWSKLDFRAVREYLAGQEGKEPRAKQALADEQAGAMIDALRQATAALLEADKAYNPDQPRYPAGDPRGGQWRPAAGGAVETAEPARGQGLFSLDGLPYLPAASAQQLLDGKPELRLHAIPLSMDEIEQITTMPGFRSQTKIRNTYTGDSDLAVELYTTFWDEQDGALAGDQKLTFYWPDSSWIEDEFYSNSSDFDYDDLATHLMDYEVNAYADLMRFEPKYQNQGLAAELVGRQIDMAVTKKVAEVHTDADITIGKYVWAKSGFQYADPGRAGRASRKFRTWAEARGIRPDAWPEFKTPQDVINFTVPGVKVSHYSIENKHLRPGDYDVGRAFMLDDEGHGNWEAVLDLRGLHWLRS